MRIVRENNELLRITVTEGTLLFLGLLPWLNLEESRPNRTDHFLRFQTILRPIKNLTRRMKTALVLPPRNYRMDCDGKVMPLQFILEIVDALVKTNERDID